MELPDSDHGAPRVRLHLDDPLARRGLAGVLTERGLRVTDDDADVVVLDAGAGAGVTTRVEASATPVIVLVPDASMVDALWASGARGVLPRDAEPDAIEAAVRAVAAGLSAAPQAFLRRWREPRARELDEDPIEPLTPRELEVLHWMAEGLSNKLIAVRLKISEHTAKFHVNSVLTRLGAETRTEAVVRAARLGIVTL